MAEDRPGNETDVVTKLRPRSVAGTVSRLVDMIGAKGMRLFAVIDQSAEARQAGLQLRETTLVIFGSPAAGTPAMDAAPLAALDLPLKVLTWDDAGRTKVSYYAPASIAARHRLGADLAGNLAGIGALTDALIAPQPRRRSPAGRLTSPAEAAASSRVCRRSRSHRRTCPGGGVGGYGTSTARRGWPR